MSEDETSSGFTPVLGSKTRVVLYIVLHIYLQKVVDNLQNGDIIYTVDNVTCTQSGKG